MMPLVKNQIQEAAQFIEEKIGFNPQIGLILGSGLGVLADLIEDAKVIAYQDIPHFPVSTVEGHAGELVAGQIKGKNVIMMKGRFHPYEGYDLVKVSFPVRVLKQLGVTKLIVTNAAGGVNTSFNVGDLMVIKDHINFMFRNPLIGPNNNDLGVRFPDMSEAYSKKLQQLSHEVAAEQNFKLQEGVYAAVMGPSYETPAEIRMLRTIGADAVGMSTVPEVIAARHAGIEVLGFSCVTNMAAGILDQPLSHEEVIETTERVKPKFLKLVLGIIEAL
ncbi:purine nucleoside phosphorylase 1 [Paenibacillus larvae subsp. larvae]|uniref:Purine nucleoside phosphorylase n=2 Tax=Paenibacillus larvae TaxID=1464 RepID=A0A6C0QPZ2_9BACL|nr:purine-nucleoside phosphorylase [Paenibacillus larvae subsp. larvae]AVF23460.1 purine nucleoside phosphorylase 1 [Paenibacillus larvae subsp. larvae]ETK25855.1 purine nucleoside phosphorylase 1 [Paenibacillus larvae subsp. larvae DSM 25719]PCK71936.1 purine nucleoside phosphorylase-like protein [Paenibacillus larvae subsp. larvae B-3650]QHZ50774.1 purine nucleoside phosphorylase 1 [Paenibacillus larvae subsp. larvae]